MADLQLHDIDILIYFCHDIFSIFKALRLEEALMMRVYIPFFAAITGTIMTIKDVLGRNALSWRGLIIAATGIILSYIAYRFPKNNN